MNGFSTVEIHSVQGEVASHGECYSTYSSAFFGTTPEFHHNNDTSNRVGEVFQYLAEES